MIAAPLTAFGARIAQERLGIPLVTVGLQPSALRSSLQPPIVRPLPLSRHLPSWNRLLYALADRVAFNPLVREETNAFRTELGLGPIRGSFPEWAFSPARILGLFPEWFALELPTGQKRCNCVSFPFTTQTTTHRFRPRWHGFSTRTNHRLFLLLARPCGIRGSFSRLP